MIESINFNYDSWHANVYRLVYGKDVPEEGCSYTWTLLLAIVLFIPTLIWACVPLIGKYVNWKAYHSKNSKFLFYIMEEEDRNAFWGLRTIGNLLFWLIVWLIGELVYHTVLYFMITDYWHEILEIWQGFGLIFGGLCTFIFLQTLFGEHTILYFIKRSFRRFVRRSEFIKLLRDKYNGLCPKINWIGKDGQTSNN